MVLNPTMLTLAQRVTNYPMLVRINKWKNRFFDSQLMLLKLYCLHINDPIINLTAMPHLTEKNKNASNFHSMVPSYSFLLPPGAMSPINSSN